jgi:hypothetical protein
MELAYPPGHEMPTHSIDAILDARIAAIRVVCEGGE